MKITVVGLGPGPYSMLTREASATLEQAPKVWLRTARHPTVAELPPSVQWESLDYVYDRCESFDCLYRELAEEVLSIARREGGAVYAVPGDPSVAEDSVRELLRMAHEAGIEVSVVPGVSFVEAGLAAARTTLSGAIQVLEAGRVSVANPLLDLLIYQVEDSFVASDVKLELLHKYADDHQVVLIHSAGGTGRQSVETVHLHDLDRQGDVDHLTVLYLPASAPERAIGSFDAFVRIVAKLRAPDGCPWDREQTHSTLRPYVVEEAYEVVEAIDKGDPVVLSEELGDLLLQVLLHAQIASEIGEFDLNDVVAAIAAKMVRRHPHVFGEVSVSGAQEVLANWEAIKRAEKEQDEEQSMFSGIPKHMPALQAAQEVQGRASRVGFDWKDLRGPLDKVAEEIEELSRETDASALQAEFGDIIFALVNAARHLGVNAEMALRAANRKFVERFSQMEALARDQGVDFASLSLEQQESLWNQVKARETA